MKRKRTDIRSVVGEPMLGWVICDCGSSNVFAHDRHDHKGRLISVIYRCGDCGARSKVGR